MCNQRPQIKTRVLSWFFRDDTADFIHSSQRTLHMQMCFVYSCSVFRSGCWPFRNVVIKQTVFVCLPLGLSPPFFWSPADIEVQFSVRRPPGEIPFPPRANTEGAQGTMQAEEGEGSRRGDRGEEEGEERVEERGHISILLTAFPFSPNTHSLSLSLSVTSSAERPAGNRGRRILLDGGERGEKCVAFKSPGRRW